MVEFLADWAEARPLLDILCGPESERPAYYLGLADVVICTIGEVADYL